MRKTKVKLIPITRNGKIVNNHKPGTKLPKKDKILDRNVPIATKRQTMYGPIQNLGKSLGSGLRNNVGPFGTRWAGRLKYTDYISLNTNTAGAYNEYQFKLNSLYHPDQIGTGHQPLGFDQLVPIYSRYRVLKTFYKITSCNQVANQSTATAMVVYVNNSGTPYTSVSQAIEEGYSHFRFNNTFQNTKILKGSVDLPALNGVNLETYRGSDRYSSVVVSSPSEVMNLHIGCESSDAMVGGIRFYIELEFDCEFFDDLELPQSTV